MVTNSSIPKLKAAASPQAADGRKANIGQTAAFRGLGGLGKTQLAIEYAYRYRDQYPDGVIWINADQNIDAQLVEIAEKARTLNIHPAGL